MKYTFTGKNMSLTEDIKQTSEKKINRLAKLLPDSAEVFVAVSKVRHQHKMEVSIPLHKRLLRAEVTAGEINACLDSVVDILEKQVKKYKGQLRERSRRNVATTEEQSYMTDHEEPTEIVIHRTKRFAIKPMDAHDAIIEMDLLNHSFFVFRSAATDEINVVYKRKDGEYGLIEPQ
ncbi:MAG: ribosome-associated translation inhibitor RaiA [Defluviitaleaceae bacterium]|nr:ribosome-associated translation inhibitor RaiA [Defluviitaleaceae bacterium]